jgi:hypothetical protein
MPGREGWAEAPPAWALPVTAAGDLVLVREGGVLVSVGAICACPVGFVFYLTISLDPRRAAAWRKRGTGSRVLGFHVRTPEERESAARIVVIFPGGKTADSVAGMTGVTAGEPVLSFAGGDSVIPAYAPVLRAESRWWVSPLPGPGRVGFSVFLQGAAEPVGTASMDAAAIIEAAARSEALWPGVEPAPP